MRENQCYDAGLVLHFPRRSFVCTPNPSSTVFFFFFFISGGSADQVPRPVGEPQAERDGCGGHGRRRHGEEAQGGHGKASRFTFLCSRRQAMFSWRFLLLLMREGVLMFLSNPFVHPRLSMERKKSWNEVVVFLFLLVVGCDIFCFVLSLLTLVFYFAKHPWEPVITKTGHTQRRKETTSSKTMVRMIRALQHVCRF